MAMAMSMSSATAARSANMPMLRSSDTGDSRAVVAAIDSSGAARNYLTIPKHLITIKSREIRPIC